MTQEERERERGRGIHALRCHCVLMDLMLVVRAHVARQQMLGTYCGMKLNLYDQFFVKFWNS